MLAAYAATAAAVGDCLQGGHLTQEGCDHSSSGLGCRWQDTLLPALAAAGSLPHGPHAAADFEAWIAPQLAQAPFPIVGLHDILWWLNFSCKWQQVGLRCSSDGGPGLPCDTCATGVGTGGASAVGGSGSVEAMSTGSMCGLRWGGPCASRGGVRHFFESRELELWSCTEEFHRCKFGDYSDWRSYKEPLKAFILAFTRDENYYETKEKVGSLNHGVPAGDASDAVERLLGFLVADTVASDSTDLNGAENVPNGGGGGGGGSGGGGGAGRVAAAGAAVLPLRWALDVPIGGNGGGGASGLDSGGGGGGSGSGGENDGENGGGTSGVGGLVGSLRHLVLPGFLASVAVGSGCGPASGNRPISAVLVDPWGATEAEQPDRVAGVGSEGKGAEAEAAGPCPFGEGAAPWFAQVSTTVTQSPLRAQRTALGLWPPSHLFVPCLSLPWRTRQDDERQQRSWNPVTLETLRGKCSALLPAQLVRGRSVLDLGSCLGAMCHYALAKGAT